MFSVLLCVCLFFLGSFSFPSEMCVYFIVTFVLLSTYRPILCIIGVSINSKLLDLGGDLLIEWDFAATSGISVL